MAALGHQAECLDAAGDFFYRFLLGPDHLHQAMTLLGQRLSSGELDRADDTTQELGKQILAQGPIWSPRVEAIAAASARLQSKASFEPSRLVKDLQSLVQMLALISAAYYPSSFSRSGFHHPGLNHHEDVKDFTNNTRLNPFLQYGNAMAAPWSDTLAPAVVMVLVTSPGQVAPAAGLMTAWRRHKPDAIFIAAGEQPLVDAVHAAVDADLPGCLPAEVLRLWEAFQGRWLNESVDEAEICNPQQLPDDPDLGLLILPLQADAMQEVTASAEPLKDKTLVWQAPAGELKSITGHLYTLARQGCWNHLVLPDQMALPLVDGLIKFAEANPNIIHSWSLRGQAPSRFSDPVERWPAGSARYGETAKLPGLPLWQVLQDPAWIAVLQRRLGAKTLVRQRVDPMRNQVYEIGRELAYHFCRPAELPDGYLDEICRMVAAGGSVGTQWLRYNLERAFLITYVEERGVIVGNSSLKHPRQEYIEAVSAQSGLDLRNYLERGYTSVRPEYRGFGIGAKLLEGLTERAAGYKIFSIIGEDNVATQKMAIRNRTRKVASFMSQRAGKQVGVWIPEWMLPAGIALPPQPDFAATPPPPMTGKEE